MGEIYIAGVCLPLRLVIQFTCLDLHYVQTYNVTSKRTYIDYFDIIVAAVPIIFLESRTNPFCYMVRESFDIETQLCYRDTRHYLKILHHKHIFAHI